MTTFSRFSQEAATGHTNNESNEGKPTSKSKKKKKAAETEQPPAAAKADLDLSSAAAICFLSLANYSPCFAHCLG